MCERLIICVFRIFCVFFTRYRYLDLIQIYMDLDSCLDLHYYVCEAETLL